MEEEHTHFLKDANNEESSLDYTQEQQIFKKYTYKGDDENIPEIHIHSSSTVTKCACKKDDKKVEDASAFKSNNRNIKWGTVVRAIALIGSTFVIHILTVGLSFSIGVYYVVFLQVFNQGNGLTAWIGSLNFAALCAAGPVSSYLIEKIGCYKTIVIGGLISTIGLLTSVFAVNIYMLFTSFGLITGVGFGLCFTANLSVISYNFDKWRVTCMGISLSGVGFGTFLHPFLANYLLDNYGWRGSLLITTALTMHVCLAGMIIWVAEDKTDNNNNAQNNSETDNAQEYKSETKKAQKSKSETDYAQEYKSETKKAQKSKSETDYAQEYKSETKKAQKSNCESEDYNKNISTITYDPEINKSIWASPMYLALHANVFFYCFGQSVIYTHIAAFASNVGFNTSECSSFISIVGIANLLGRILLGLVPQHPGVNVTLLYIICYLSAGLWTVLFILCRNYILMAVIVSALGIAMAAFGPLLGEIVCETVGVQNFAKAYGFLMVSMAVGTLLGAPTAGWLYDFTYVYNNSFYIGGASFVISAFTVMVPAIWKKLFQKKNTSLSYVINKQLSYSSRFISNYGSQPLILETVISSV